MNALTILVALALVFFGRRLYWLFVGGIGFIFGAQLASHWFVGLPEWEVLLIAIGVGLIAASLAVLLQRVALGFAGFVAGGYFAMALLQPLGIDAAQFGVVAFIVGGIVAAILVLALLDPALILLSSLVGAAAFAQAVTAESAVKLVVFVVFFAAGAIVQWWQLSGRSAAEPTDIT